MKTKTILLLDDDEMILATFAIALRQQGYHVLEASSGDEGLELARKHLPDLIISDIAMPGTDGKAVLQSIRQNPELSTTQVVLMTGDAGAVTPRKGMDMGADDFLLKPINLEDLLHCVDARLRRAQIHWRVEDQMLTTLRTSLQSHLPHELFTPLGGIIGLADILLSDLTILSPEESTEMIKDIYVSAMRLHRTLRNYLLILDLQATSRESASPDEQLTAEELKESLLAGIQASAQRHQRAKDVDMNLEVCPVIASAGDMNLIAEELIDNACKFSRAGTPIKIHFDTSAVLTVTDSGRGMTPEQIEHVGSFQQFDRKTQEQQGLGLGLALVQKLTTKWDAKFLIGSKPSQGTTVKVAFRRPDPAPVAE